MVPTLRTAGSPMTDAVSEITGHLLFRRDEDSTSQCVVMAPMEMTLPSSLMPLRPGILRRSMRFLGWARRSFIMGMRLWPPATSLASSSLPSRPSASFTVEGLWYSNEAGYMTLGSYLPALEAWMVFHTR